MANIFLSYRRTDSVATSGRIYDRLIAKFGRERIFKDIDDIPAGADFVEYIQQSLRECVVALVIIGTGWLSASTGTGVRRLDDPTDFVRLEIETALQLGLTVIPVLVDGATIPLAEQLPESLRKLNRLNALEVRHDPDFDRDMERVLAALDRALGGRRGIASEPATAQVTTVSASAPSGPMLSLPGVTATSGRPRGSPVKRSTVLATVAVILVAAALAVLLSAHSQASSAGNGTTQNTLGAATNTAVSSVTVAPAATLTPTAPVSPTAPVPPAPSIVFPYSASAPGPNCDKGNAPWSLRFPTAQTNVQCFSDHTRLTSGDMQWQAPQNTPFPQSFTVSVQVSNLSTYAQANLEITLQNGYMATLALDSAQGPGAASFFCDPSSSCSVRKNLNFSTAGVHTLSITVNGTHITYTVDGNSFDSVDSSVLGVMSMDLYDFYATEGNSAASADFSNLNIG